MGIPTTILRCIIFSLTLVSAIFTIAATASSYWITFKDGDAGYQGLWEACGLLSTGVMGCQDLGYKINTLNTVRAFMIMSCIGYAIAISIMVLHQIKKLLNLKVAAGAIFAVVIFEIIAMSVYTNDASDIVQFQYVKYGWSYAFGWTSAILSIVAGVFCFFDNGYAEV